MSIPQSPEPRPPQLLPESTVEYVNSDDEVCTEIDNFKKSSHLNGYSFLRVAQKDKAEHPLTSWTQSIITAPPHFHVWVSSAYVPYPISPCPYLLNRRDEVL